MATLTIRNLDDDVKARLRVDAALHDRSMEEHARVLLAQALTTPRTVGLGTWIHSLVADLEGGGVELDLPPRSGDLRPVVFDD